MKRLGALTAAAGLLAVTLAQLSLRTPASAETLEPSVTASPTTQLTDGQNVTITIHARPPTQALTAQAQLCRDGVAYGGASGFTPNADVTPNGPNCPQQAISTSGDPAVTDPNISANAASADGEQFFFKVGSGVQNWTDRDGNAQSLTCDETHPCDLVVELRYSPGQDSDGRQLAAVWKPFIFKMNYGNGNPLAACGTPPADPVGTASGDRLQDAWIAWSLGACRLPDAKGAPTRASFVGEGNAVNQFVTGAVDLAYTAGGYDKDMALLTSGATQRPAVAIPLALNATVLAVGGGQSDGSKKVPYKEIDLTPGEAAGILTGGLTEADRSAIFQRSAPGNVQLGQTGLFDPAVASAVAAYPDAEAFSWYAARFFRAIVPDQWIVPNNTAHGEDAGKPLPLTAEWASQATTPSYSSVISLLSGRPAIVKDMQSATRFTSGGVWFLMDLVTAHALSFTPVSMGNADGTFVTPNDASLTAAIATMKANDQGILISDAKVTAQQSGVTPYPMTFVEYALVPTQPLLNDDCSPRTDTQKAMVDWLKYVTTDGQSTLPAGMVPLTDALKKTAADNIAKVGKDAVTGPCAKTDSDSGAPLADTAQSGESGREEAALASPASELPTSADASIVSTLGAGPIAAAVNNLSSMLGVPELAAAPPPVTATPEQAATLAVVTAAIPPFGGRWSIHTWLTLLSLLVIAGMTSGALYLTSRLRA